VRNRAQSRPRRPPPPTGRPDTALAGISTSSLLNIWPAETVPGVVPQCGATSG
jgi:hypothetical protein